MLVKGGLHGSALVDTFGVRTPIFSEKSIKEYKFEEDRFKVVSNLLILLGDRKS